VIIELFFAGVTALALRTNIH